MNAMLAVLVLLGSAVAASAQPGARLAEVPAQSAQGPGSTITPVPVPEIAQRAEQVTTALRSAQAPAAELREAELELMRAADWIAKRHVTTTETLASSPSGSALANLADSCQAMRARLVRLNGKLTNHATLAQVASSRSRACGRRGWPRRRAPPKQRPRRRC